MDEIQLRQALADLDITNEAELEEVSNQIAAALQATESAGNEYEELIAAAQEQVAGAIETYNTNVSTAQTKQASAQSSAEAVTATDASDEIAAIGTVSSPTVASNDVVDIQTALDALAADINARIAEIVTALTALNNPDATEGLKSATQDLAASNAAIIAGALPPAVDTQPEIDEAFSLIEGLR